jgi:hypothetical protein
MFSLLPGFFAKKRQNFVIFRTSKLTQISDRGKIGYLTDFWLFLTKKRVIYNVDTDMGY